MPVTVLATKLHIPAPLPRAVPRERLLAQLARASEQRLVLVSAPAGFGKSSLLGAWIAASGQRVAWLSLDADDGDPVRFLLYVVAALRTVEPELAPGVWAALQTPQPPPLDTLVPALLNDLARVAGRLCLVLDDYHVLDSVVVDEIVTTLLENLPPTLTVVIATREDPRLPLPRLRGRGQMIEIRAADLRFTADEARDLLNHAMGLDLSPAQIEALEARTEGWIAGLQLAALSLQGRADAAGFIHSFTGSHRFIMDYLVEEVLARQPDATQSFLLRTAILDRLCGPLCDAVLDLAPGSGQAELAKIERANLFIVPLDDERRWFRYHHLFAELLRQRRFQAGGLPSQAEDHARASLWFESQGLDAEAFHHAVASGNVDLAAKLVTGAGGMPLHFRGVVAPVLAWLDTLAPAELDARPALWVMWASAQLFMGRIEGIEAKLRAAEARLKDDDPDPVVRDLVGHIASIRATVAVSLHRRDDILEQAQRALHYIDRGNLPVMTAACWSLGYAHHLRGDIAAAHQAYSEALSVAEAIGHGMIVLLSTLGVGGCEEAWGDHDQALATYERVIALAGDPPLPVSAEALLGTARIHLTRGDLDGAEASGQRARQLARLMPTTDREFACDVVLARIQLARGDLAAAAARLASARQAAEQRGFASVIPEIEAAQVDVDRARGTAVAGPDALSARELEVLRLTAQGLSNGQIAERLVVALSTVKGHQQRIFEKLHVERRTEAVARARELGLL